SQIRLDLIEHGLERPRIDREQQVTGLYVVAFVEMNLSQLAAHLSLDRDGRIGLDVADDVDLQRHVLLRDGSHSNWHSAFSPAASGSLSTLAGAACRRKHQ